MSVWPTPISESPMASGSCAPDVAFCGSFGAQSGFSARNSGSYVSVSGFFRTDARVRSAPARYDWVSSFATSRALSFNAGNRLPSFSSCSGVAPEPDCQSMFIAMASADTATGA